MTVGLGVAVEGAQHQQAPLGVDARAIILDTQPPAARQCGTVRLRERGIARCRHPAQGECDGACAVLAGIVDQIGQCLLQLPLDAQRPGGAIDVRGDLEAEVHAGAITAQEQPADGGARQRRQLQRHARRLHLRVVEACQRQQLIGQMGGMAGGGLHLAQRGMPGAGVLLAQCQLGVSGESRQRGAQLVRGITDEALLVGAHAAHARQQVIDGVLELLELARQGQVERRQTARVAFANGAAQAGQRRQRQPDADQHHQQCQRGHARQTHQRATEQLTRQGVSPLAGMGDANAVTLAVAWVIAPAAQAGIEAAQPQCLSLPGDIAKRQLAAASE